MATVHLTASVEATDPGPLTAHLTATVTVSEPLLWIRQGATLVPAYPYQRNGSELTPL